MNTAKFRLRKPEQLQPFRWPVFLTSLVIGATVMFVFGLAMDNALRVFGVGISSWFDAFWDSFITIFFGAVIAPIFWRVGLVTFPQYLLGALALVVPISIISVLILSNFHDVGIEVPGIDSEAFPNRFLAVTAYVRLIRAMIFVPVFLASFYWIYHVFFGMAPRGSTSETAR